MNIYNPNGKNGIVQVNPSQLLTQLGLSESAEFQNTTIASSMMNENVFEELLDNKELLKKQYDIIAGRMPENYDETVLILNKSNEISDYTLYALGIMN